MNHPNNPPPTASHYGTPEFPKPPQPGFAYSVIPAKPVSVYVIVIMVLSLLSIPFTFLFGALVSDLGWGCAFGIICSTLLMGLGFMFLAKMRSNPNESGDGLLVATIIFNGCCLAIILLVLAGWVSGHNYG